VLVQKLALGANQRASRSRPSGRVVMMFVRNKLQALLTEPVMGFLALLALAVTLGPVRSTPKWHPTLAGALL